jgi:cation diffusion facilitator CzcD-associated flavoprotein CzcO
MDPEILASAKARYQELRKRQRTLPNGIAGFGGAQMFPPPRPVRILDASEQDLEDALEELGWGACRAWSDVLTDTEANELAVELYRRMIRRTVRDPATADALSPHYPLGCKRPILDTEYFETFNRDNVTLVDIAADPLARVTATGVETVGGRHHDLDVLVLATGFDALTGSLLRPNVVGRAGLTLREKWAAGPVSHLGIGVHGFPNMFVLAGPGSPALLINVLVGIELHVDWLADLMAAMEDKGASIVEVDADAESRWVQHVNERAEQTLYPLARSYYMGDEVPGKPRVFMMYAGGLRNYRRILTDTATNDYAGFGFTRSHADV